MGGYSTTFVPVIPERLHLADDLVQCRLPQGRFHFFSNDENLSYASFCDDFGPMNLACVMRFVEVLGKKMSQITDKEIVYVVEGNPRQLTNGVFLMGSYLILEHKQTPEQVWNCFQALKGQLEMYRDATYSQPDFRLTLLDCWRGLTRAVQLGWVDSYNMEEYCHYDNPLEGDMHEMVPGKLIAFRGPQSLPYSNQYKDSNGCRHFSPSFYVEPFRDMNVSTVVRLNEAEYAACEFEDHGIRCVDLEFEDCTSPPNHVLLEFLHIVDNAPGLVAVHCKAGLGRTGTLIACYMMRSCGFSAREAIGWLRIVRPGAVIGEQQHYLCSAQPESAASAGAPEERWDDSDVQDDASAVPGPATVWSKAPPCGDTAPAEGPSGTEGLGSDSEANLSASESVPPRRRRTVGRGSTQECACQLTEALDRPERTALRALAARRFSWSMGSDASALSFKLDSDSARDAASGLDLGLGHEPQHPSFGPGILASELN